MIRPYRGTDIDEIIKIWNEAMPYNVINRQQFVKNILLDPNFDENGFLVAEDSGKITGFIYGIVRKYPVDVGGSLTENEGYIDAIGLKNESDILGGLGKSLIKAAEGYIHSFGNRTVFVSGYTPNYIYQGINTKYSEYMALFEGEGYTVYDVTASIAIDLLNFKPHKDILELKCQREKEGFCFTYLRDEYIHKLMQYQRPGWRYRYRRLINETMDYQKVHLALFKGEVIGCTVFGDPYSVEERFGPFGVYEEFRGLGIGKILLHDCLCTMKERGLQKAWAQNTPLNSPAGNLYQKMGFEYTNQYYVYKKDPV